MVTSGRRSMLMVLSKKYLSMVVAGALLFDSGRHILDKGI